MALTSPQAATVAAALNTEVDAIVTALSAWHTKCDHPVITHDAILTSLATLKTDITSQVA